MTELPIPRGRSPLCACGCGHRTSTVRTAYILGHRPLAPIRERLEARTERTDGCWRWTGAMFPNGYGSLSNGDGGRLMAHRAAYEEYVGPIADGLVIDHLCRNRACVNPEHMEPVTPGVNALRGGGLAIAHANYRARTHCKRGHEYTPENTYRDRAGKRGCRTCRSDARRRHEQRKRATA